MLRRTGFSAVFALVALVAATAFAPSAVAAPGESAACSICHGGAALTVNTTLVSMIGATATYDFSAPGADAVAIFRGSTKIATFGVAAGTFMVPVGSTYDLFAVAGPGESDGLGTTSVSPVGAPVDTTAPVTTSDAVATYASMAAINLTATDAGSGVASTHYTLDGGTETAGTAIAVTALGSHTISFYSVDVAGNIEAPKTATFTITAVPVLDTTAPVTTSDAVATYVTSAAINLTATDAGSGVASTHYTLDGGTETAGTAIAVTALGSHTISFYSVDVAGNIEAPKTATFTITAVPVLDTTAPVTTSDAVATYVTSAAINLTATDAGSGVASTHYTLDGGTETAGTAIAVTALGSHTISFYSVDVAGNIEAPKTATFTITDVQTPSDAATTTISIHASHARSHNGRGHWYRRHNAPKSVWLSGKLSPGAKDLPVSLYVMKRGSTTWELVKVLNTKSSHRSDRGSWSYRFTPETRGAYRLQVRFAGNEDFSASESRIISVRAR